MMRWYNGTMVHGSMVRLIDGDDKKDEDEDKDDDDYLFFWHNNQPCGRMHSCQRGSSAQYLATMKDKDGEQ